jgi:Cellulase (glycosyl hydrolase family 5)
MPTRSLLYLAACLVALLAPPAASAARPFQTAIFDPFEYASPDRNLAFDHVVDSGATTVRLSIGWSSIAPPGTYNEADGTTARPENFDASDPLDPQYSFDALDKQVIAATQHGLEPILTLVHAPGWAERTKPGPHGARSPDPDDFGAFAEAVARRYDGSTLGLPRVRYFQIWNEPNLHVWLMPQYSTPFTENVPPGAETRSPELYRQLVKAASASIHGVDRSNLVIAGGLAPFGREFAFRHAVTPLRFMRDFLCLTPENKPKPDCKPIHFDIWSTHPYTEGGPNHKAEVLNNVSMGNLPEMRKVLNAALQHEEVASLQAVRFWVTEFSWETKPPDKGGVPTRLHARWLAEAFYRMWQSRISLVTWFKVRDETVPSDNGVIFQSGLFANCGDRCYRAKRSFRAFRFPFVAFKKGKHVKVWGRTPTSQPVTVLVEQKKRKGGWRKLRELEADRYGVFKGRLKRRGRGPVRATVFDPERERALPFELKKTPDMPLRLFGAD